MRHARPRNRFLAGAGRPLRWLALAALLTASGHAHVGGEAEVAQKAAYQQAALIKFSGTIGSLNEHYFYRKLGQAREAGADLVIVEIDSPGGELEASLNLARRLRDTRWAHTVAYIPREALSGAAIMALGCDDIILADNAVIGNAGPIFLDDAFMFQHAPEKIRSDLARKVRDLATAKNRPPALAEAMVDDKLVVYRVKEKASGKIAFMTDAEINASANPQGWEKLQPVLESRDEKFLELNGRRAVELQLAQGNAASLQELRAIYPFPGDPLVFSWSGLDTTVLVLNHPLVTALLIMVGLVALFVEFSSPGIGIGGLLAGLCFALFFWSRFLGGTAEWLEFLLFAAGVVFLLVELFVLPGFGIAGLAGVLLIISSLILASQSFLVPRSTEQFNALLDSLLLIFGAGVAAIIGCALVVKYFGTIPLLNRLALEPPPPATVAPSGPPHTVPDAEGKPLKVGDRGQARTTLRPAGQCRFGARKVDVVADGAFINAGTQVEIVDISSNRIMVCAVE
ncbi:MAG: peptidase [Planctomycetales bacterium]|nr:peptidase [Planctomycetales bacterium]NIM08995.1 peptidase [Planctomycetales bacterium]NIN08458.1 peptidase [Planctomycetales bacterium]NIN77592.1 peptidase [Planctomycetales bacterium]NIO34757.1 peptidase [Planctomycetales bacterium]